MTVKMPSSYMPGNTTTDEHELTSNNMGASMPSLDEDAGNGASGAYFVDGPFNELRQVARITGQDQAMAHFGVKASSLVGAWQPPTNQQNVTPRTNQDNVPALRALRKENIPDAGTGYATSGAQYGADIRK